MRAKFHKAWCQQSTVWPNKCYMMDSSSKVNLQCLSSAKVNVCFFVLMYIFTGESQEQVCICGSATEAVMEKKNTAKQVHVSKCVCVCSACLCQWHCGEVCGCVATCSCWLGKRESCITSYNQWWGCLAKVYSFCSCGGTGGSNNLMAASLIISIMRLEFVKNRFNLANV